jgi:very-short-patch-repair endonuclease
MEARDAAAVRQAARQHGLVTAAQLAELGMSRAAVRRRVRSGRWTEVEPRVVRVAGSPATWESDVLARVLGAGAGAVASHRTAGVLWGLDGCRPGAPELTIPRGRQYRRPGVRVHQSTDLALVRPVLRRGIPTTPVARTLLDLGAVLPPSQVHLALDSARRHRLTDWDALLTTLTGHARRGRDGVGVLRAILDDHFGEVAATDSGFERLVVTLLVGAGLPAPVLQHEVVVGGRRYRLDLSYPDAGVAIELDGLDHLRHDVFESDRPRQNSVVLAGWTVLRFTWRQYRDTPDRIVADVRRALTRN